MVANRQMGDRRAQVRYDISGQLWGALTVHAPIVLKNIAPGGALLEARLSTGLKSLRTGQIVLREHGPELNVVVRHVTPATTVPGEDRYLVGVEFVNLSPAARADVERCVRECQDRQAGA